MSRTTKLRIGLVALAAAIVAVPSIAGAAGAETKVKIKEDAPGDFRGKVKSSDSDCVEDRKVKVFKQLGSSPDPKSDRKIATDTADADGKWSVGNTGQKGGKHYAYAPRKSGCKAGTSETI